MKTPPTTLAANPHRTTRLCTAPMTWHQLALPCCLTLALMAGMLPSSHGASLAADHDAAKPAAAKVSAEKPAESASATPAAGAKGLVGDLRSALKDGLINKKNMIPVLKDKPTPSPMPKPAASSAKAVGHADSTEVPAVARARALAATVRRISAQASAAVNSRDSRAYIKAKAAALVGHEAPVRANEAHATDAHAGDVRWAYEGENGPLAWGKLKPEFNVCAIGKRQSPININDANTLQGPAEPLQFNYTPSSGTVVNNGHTIQVDLQGDNSLTVRGSVFKLVQFHFHTPSEELVNDRNYAMVAHLVHKNSEGQVAVVAVLLDPGVANAVVNKVWTYMPLDQNDRVRVPAGSVDMNDLLPKDQRYYQFIGSMTTPPCTEGVLWIVLKQATQISPEQLRLFQQLYPNNARPVQPVNGRVVRNAQ